MCNEISEVILQFRHKEWSKASGWSPAGRARGFISEELIGGRRVGSALIS
jgi:hypothetical protein